MSVFYPPPPILSWEAPTKLPFILFPGCPEQRGSAPSSAALVAALQKRAREFASLEFIFLNSTIPRRNFSGAPDSPGLPVYSMPMVTVSVTRVFLLAPASSHPGVCATHALVRSRELLSPVGWVPLGFVLNRMELRLQLRARRKAPCLVLFSLLPPHSPFFTPVL